MYLKFNDSAHSYSQYAVVQRRLTTWLVEWLEPPHQTAALSALELGAGDGLFTRLLAPQFAHTTAIDVAPRMVQQGLRQLPQVEWRVADGWRCKFGPVDRLFSASLLHWCDDPVKVLRHWRALVKKGAHMLHGFYVAPTLVEWESIAGSWSPIKWRTAAQWEEHFREAGWIILRSEARIHEQRFSSALALLRFFHRTGAVMPRKSSVRTVRRMLADINRSCTSANDRSGVATTWTFFRVEAVSQ
jgi:SAM-dependent methyltransferase